MAQTPSTQEQHAEVAKRHLLALPAERARYTANGPEAWRQHLEREVVRFHTLLGATEAEVRTSLTEELQAAPEPVAVLEELVLTQRVIQELGLEAELVKEMYRDDAG